MYICTKGTTYYIFLSLSLCLNAHTTPCTTTPPPPPSYSILFLLSEMRVFVVVMAMTTAGNTFKYVGKIPENKLLNPSFRTIFCIASHVVS